MICIGCGHEVSSACGTDDCPVDLDHKDLDDQDPGDENDGDTHPDRWLHLALAGVIFRYGGGVVYWPATRVYHPDHDPGDEQPTLVKNYGVFRYALDI